MYWIILSKPAIFGFVVTLLFKCMFAVVLAFFHVVELAPYMCVLLLLVFVPLLVVSQVRGLLSADGVLEAVVDGTCGGAGLCRSGRDSVTEQRRVRVPRT